MSDYVDNESIGQLTWSILHQLAEDDEKDKKEKDYKREPIKIYINSYDGEVYDMWGLIDIIVNSKTPIYTYCTGYAMSAAFKIFLAGHKRYCYKHSTFMFHQSGCWISGKYTDIKENMAEHDRMNILSIIFLIEHILRKKNWIVYWKRNKISILIQKVQRNMELLMKFCKSECGN